MEEINVRFPNEEAAARAVSRIAEHAASFYWEGFSLRVLPLPGREAPLRQILEGEGIFLSPSS